MDGKFKVLLLCLKAEYVTGNDLHPNMGSLSSGWDYALMTEESDSRAANFRNVAGLVSLSLLGLGGLATHQVGRILHLFSSEASASDVEPKDGLARVLVRPGVPGPLQGTAALTLVDQARSACVFTHGKPAEWMAEWMQDASKEEARLYGSIAGPNGVVIPTEEAVDMLRGHLLCWREVVWQQRGSTFVQKSQQEGRGPNVFVGQVRAVKQNGMGQDALCYLDLSQETSDATASPVKIQDETPTGPELLSREAAVRTRGTGLTIADCLGNWQLQEVWPKQGAQPNSFSSLLLRAVGARLEIQPGQGAMPFAVSNAVNLGALEMRFTGEGFFRGKRPLLMFYFSKLDIKFFGRVLVTRNIDKPSEQKMPFFALIARGKNWLAARGRGGGLAMWKLDRN
eukprot:g3461.t1